jgi:hypothetical protein
MLIFFVDDYSHKFYLSFFSFSLHNHRLSFFSLLLKKRKVRFFQTCLIWLFAILWSYLHQQKISQSREIYGTWCRKVNLKKLQRLSTYVCFIKRHVITYKNKYQCPSTWLHLYLRYPSNWSIASWTMLGIKQFLYH